MTGSTIPPFPPSGGQKPDQVSFFWGCDKSKDNKKTLGWEKRGIILSMGRNNTNHPYFNIVIGLIKRYPSSAYTGGHGYDIENGRNKGCIVVEDSPLESIDRADTILISVLPDNKVKLELYKAGGQKCPGKSIKEVTYGPEVTQTIKNMGFDLTDNADNLGKTLSYALSQYLYDFALGQDDFAPPKETPKTNPKK